LRPPIEIEQAAGRYGPERKVVSPPPDFEGRCGEEQGRCRYPLVMNAAVAPSGQTEVVNFTTSVVFQPSAI